MIITLIFLGAQFFFDFFFSLLQDESVPYSFYVNESEITGSLKETLEIQTLETEKVVEIVYQPQAVFKVRAVTRCTSTIPGKIFQSKFVITVQENK